MLLPEKDPYIEQNFPALVVSDYKITSPIDPNYNCIAWAASVANAWWEPDAFGQYFWPQGVSRTYTVESYIQAYATLGYQTCASHDLESGFEKVAIFVDHANVPTHAARQLDANFWTSKLGQAFDIRHVLSGVSGIIYGTPTVFMKRSKIKTA